MTLRMKNCIALAFGSLWALFVLDSIKTPDTWAGVVVSAFFFAAAYLTAMVVLWALVRPEIEQRKRRCG